MLKCFSIYFSRVTFYGNAFQHMFEAEHIFHQEIGKVSECSKLQYDILFQIFLMTSESSFILTLLLLNTTCPVLANSVDPDQLASEEAN